MAVVVCLKSSRNLFEGTEDARETLQHRMIHGSNVFVQSIKDYSDFDLEGPSKPRKNMYQAMRHDRKVAMPIEVLFRQ